MHSSFYQGSMTADPAPGAKRTHFTVGQTHDTRKRVQEGKIEGPRGKRLLPALAHPHALPTIIDHSSPVRRASGSEGSLSANQPRVPDGVWRKPPTTQPLVDGVSSRATSLLRPTRERAGGPIRPHSRMVWEGVTQSGWDATPPKADMGSIIVPLAVATAPTRPVADVASGDGALQSDVADSPPAMPLVAQAPPRAYLARPSAMAMPPVGKGAAHKSMAALGDKQAGAVGQPAGEGKPGGGKPGAGKPVAGGKTAMPKSVSLPAIKAAPRRERREQEQERLEERARQLRERERKLAKQMDALGRKYGGEWKLTYSGASHSFAVVHPIAGHDDMELIEVGEVGEPGLVQGHRPVRASEVAFDLGELEDRENVGEAAARLQAVQRRRRAEKERKVHVAERQCAATKLAAARRGQQARLKVKRQVAERRDEEFKAAATVQTAMRGKAARAELKATMSARNDAATKVAAARRGQQGRRDVANLRS